MLQKGPFNTRYGDNFNGFSMHVVVLVTGLWNAHSVEEEVLEVKVTQLDVGHVTKLDILLLTITH